jgi:hypothetical protein
MITADTIVNADETRHEETVPADAVPAELGTVLRVDGRPRGLTVRAM